MVVAREYWKLGLLLQQLETQKKLELFIEIETTERPRIIRWAHRPPKLEERMMRILERKLGRTMMRMTTIPSSLTPNIPVLNA
jgi:hypothetical protein